MSKRRRRTAAIAALTAAAVVASSPGAWSADVSGTLVNAVEVNKWTPPSSDPSGIAVDSSGNLTISDGEVNETTFYKGANVFHTSRSGTLLGTDDTTGFSEEPTGIAYGPNGLIFVSDDDADAVFVAKGFDDPSPVRISTKRFMSDSEGVAYDSYRKEMLIANGEPSPEFPAGFVRYSPGTDGKYGTSDDVAGKLIAVPGATDTEGVAYDSVRDTVLLIDSGPTKRIFEMLADGTVINTISLSGIKGIDKPAGVEVAAATSGGGRNYFIVDRGKDPGTTSSVNDGMMFEVRAEGLSPAGPGVNQPPTANAGPDRSATVDEPITLEGAGSDPEGGTLTYAWSTHSGPGTVTFGSSENATTTASFPTSGQYVVRLQVTDDQGATDFDDLTVTVASLEGSSSAQIPIEMSSDDAREGHPTSPTYVSTTAKTNDLGTGVNLSGDTANMPYPTKVGLRFANIPVPQGAEIVSARIQFVADATTTSEPTDLAIVAEASDNAATYANTGAKVSTRTYTSTSVAWQPPAWLTANEQGPAQLTPELKTLLQEVVNRPGWAQFNAAAFMIEGTGRRVARSFDSSRSGSAPVLNLEFKTTGATTPPPEENKAPTVNAGTDQTITLPAHADLQGAVTDDGLPEPANLTSEWTKVSGPGEVTFVDKTQPVTKAAFAVPGDYVLRLTGDDSALTTSAEVKVRVEPAVTTPTPSNTAPSVNAGSDATVTLPNAATLDGTVSDDGLPSGSLSVSWSKVSGPGVVTFVDAEKVDTEATFAAAGTYTLRLTASDGELSESDDVEVTVKPASTGGDGGGGGTPSNAAPTVKAGADATVTLPNTATLDGTVSDDGLPSGSLSVAWSKVSGPGAVTFADDKKVDTKATFAAAGTYTLRLTASDGALTASDDVIVTVKDSGASGTTEVTLAADHSAMPHGAAVLLSGMVAEAGNGTGGATVELYVSRAGGGFQLLTSKTADGDGGFSFEDTPAVNSVYMAVSEGATSGTVRVLVRPRMGAHLRHDLVKAGTRTAIVGWLSPSTDGHLLLLQKRAAGEWRTVRTASFAAGDRTRFRFVVRPRASRAHWYRVVSPPQAGLARAVVGGKQLRLRAYSAAVKRVNHRADVVVVRNTGRVPFSLAGWMLAERRTGLRTGLPDFTVRRGRIVRIHSGEGTDDRRNLHLGTGEMWAAHGVAELRDARLRLADRLRF